ncbi:MAG: hypothetical protein EHM85_10530 [Desulfobacteraceae bacterium]|nr:MAG: hypothetical protein EHM85_10530 [Desulfobacteraceae bacterium]
MNASCREEIKIWLETWKHAAAALEKINQGKLHAYDYRKNMAVVDAMLQWACDNKKSRLTSGLVEQQRYFMKIREKEKSNKQQ